MLHDVRTPNYINKEVENKSGKRPCLMSLRGGQEKTKKKSFTWLVDFSFRPHEIHLGVMMMMMLGSSSFRSKAKGQTRLTYSSNIFFVFGLLGRIPAGTLASGVHNSTLNMYLLTDRLPMDEEFEEDQGWPIIP